MLCSANLYAQTCDTIRHQGQGIIGGRTLHLSYHNNSWLDKTLTDVFGIWSWTAQGNPLVGRMLLKYNLSHIPTNAVINSADLYLYADNTSIYGNPPNPCFGSNNSCTARRITSSWDSATITMTNYTTTNLDNVLLPQSGTYVQDYVLNIKNMVQFWVNNPTQNYGMEFRHNAEGVYYNSLIFHGYNSTNVAKHPTLVICYSIPFSIDEMDKNEFVYKGMIGNELVFNMPSNARTLEIYSIAGQKIFSSEVMNSSVSTETRVSLPQVSNGIYFAQVQVGNTKKTVKFSVNQ